ncbi:WD40-repeat-containing domain protein [Ustulina deusta]|nr:WD40-repeat-containing domain protein [Ustulina deusta]
MVATKPRALPSPSAAAPRIARPGAEARPADHYQPVAAAPQLPCPATPVESLPMPALTEPIEPSARALSVSEELWNAAYDGLEAAEAELVGSYVKTLEQILGGETGEPSPTDRLAEMKDPIKRQKHMRELVRRGQDRISNVSKITTKVGEIADFILSSKGIVSLTLQNVPQAAPAALPWAGVCLGLEILRKPAQATKSNLEGIAHVISRMDWYCALTELLLNKTNIADGNDFQAVLCQLEGRIIELYKALLLYQMKSVRSYYRNQGARFLRDIVCLDDWESDINLIKRIETTLQADAGQYYQEHAKISLNELVSQANTLTTLLGNIQQDIQSFILQQKLASRDETESNCRKDLRVVDPEDDMKRIENNKDELLDDAYKWIFETSEYIMFSNWEDGGFESPQRQVLWLKGYAGTGKTMLMIGLIRQFSNQSAALAPALSFFFCQGTDTKLNNATAVLRSLIWLLLLQQPHLISHLLQKYKDSGASLFNDSNSFYALSTVFQNMLSDTRLSPVYFAVDALDECSEGRVDLVKLISTTLALSKKVKWLLSSRPEVDVLTELKTSETLVELDTQHLEVPVRVYIQHKLKILEGKKGYSNKILTDVSDIVHQRAGNTFLWVALAFKALGRKHGEYAVELISEMPPGLSDLYRHMMTRIENSEEIKPQDCKKVLKAACLAFRPLRLSELTLVTGLSPSLTKSAVEECGSFVTITGETVNLIHQSAKDYLRDKYNVELDPAGVAEGHMNVIERSLNAISSLERNIYKLDFGFKLEDMTPPNPDPLAPLRYSCVYWIDHLCSLDNETPGCLKTLMMEMLKFLKKGFLRWLESLSLLGKVEGGLLSMKKLVHFVQSQTNVDSTLVEFVKDADRFFLSHREIIEHAPMQTYGSALVFSPTMSKVRNQYWDERRPLVEILVGAEEHWGTHQQTLEDNSWVNAIAFSPDGKTLASASVLGTIRLWDAVTGTRRQTLGKHSSAVDAVAFSPDGKALASGLRDGIIQLWDVATSVCRQTLEGHTTSVTAVVFSRDGKTLASASDDNTVQLWDTATGVRRQTFQGHSRSVNAIAFSPDGKTLASASEDMTIQLWDTVTGVSRRTLEGVDKFKTVAFSPNGNTLASGFLSSWMIQLWDIATGVCRQTLEGHTEGVNAVVFSPDGKTLASVSNDQTVRLWDITATPPNSRTFEGHIHSVYSAAFSPDGKILASASSDKTVRLWDITAILPKSKTVEGHSGWITMLRFSPDGKMLASAADDKIVRLWDTTATSPSNKTLGEYTGVIQATAFSPDGKMFALASTDRIVWLWDMTATSPSSKTLGEGPRGVNTIKFSPDGKFLQLTADKSVWYWDIVSGDCLEAIDTDTSIHPAMHGSFSGRDGPHVGNQPTDHSRPGQSHRTNHIYTVSTRSWIVLDGKDLLWLPVGCRPITGEQRTVLGSNVAIGNENGNVFIMRFLENC